jgi:hypothetical protein
MGSWPAFLGNDRQAASRTQFGGIGECKINSKLHEGLFGIWHHGRWATGERGHDAVANVIQVGRP